MSPMPLLFVHHKKLHRLLYKDRLQKSRRSYCRCCGVAAQNTTGRKSLLSPPFPGCTLPPPCTLAHTHHRTLCRRRHNEHRPRGILTPELPAWKPADDEDDDPAGGYNSAALAAAAAKVHRRTLKQGATQQHAHCCCSLLCCPLHNAFLPLLASTHACPSPLPVSLWRQAPITDSTLCIAAAAAVWGRRQQRQDA